MIRTIKKNVANFTAIIVLIVVAAVVGGYILSQQRLRFPLIEDAPIRMKAELSTAQAVAPGQGQTIRVSGVRIGDIGQVELRDGRAIVTMEIDRKYEGLVRTDATALLRPKTGLKDMFLELQPGSDSAPAAEEGFTIPVSNTLPDVNLDEVFQILDADARDYLKLLISDGGQGLQGRGPDLAEIMRRFEPTHRDLARVNGAVKQRRRNLQNLVTSLNQLTAELATKDDELADLVQTSAATFRAFASEQDNISTAIRELPSTLRQTTDTLGRVERLAEVLRPSADTIRPVFRDLDEANAELLPFGREVEPIVRTQIRPFIREARPVIRDLRPAARNLARGTPALTESFKVLNRLFNFISYNPGGRDGPSDSRSRQEGYLFHIAWISHQSLNLFSTADAHNFYRPLTLGGTCGSLRNTVSAFPGSEFVLGLTGILTDPSICGPNTGPSGTARNRDVQGDERGGDGGRREDGPRADAGEGEEG